MEFFNDLFPIELRKTIQLVMLGAFLVGVFIGIGISIYLN